MTPKYLLSQAMLTKFKQRIEDIIWSQATENPAWSLEKCLLLASRFYGALAAADRAAYSLGLRKVRRLDCRVVSVGNLVAGGSGKTPFVRWLACTLKRQGLKVAVVSRGYKGKGEKHGVLVSDGRRILASARQAGDEPWLLASTLPGVVVAAGKDRYAMGQMLADRFAPDVIILDDGMQHHSLFKDLEIVLLDGANPLGNGYLLPRGPLREPPRALSRAEVIVFACKGPVNFSKCALPPQHAHLQKAAFRAAYKPVVLFTLAAGRQHQVGWPAFCDPACLDDKLPALPFFAFSAVARGRDFGAAVKAMGAELAGEIVFSDHHWFSRSDIEQINRQALKAGARMLVTTAKDFVRLAGRHPCPLDLAVVDLMVDLEAKTEEFAKFVIDKLMVA